MARNRKSMFFLQRKLIYALQRNFIAFLFHVLNGDYTFLGCFYKEMPNSILSLFVERDGNGNKEQQVLPFCVGEISAIYLNK